ncbi:hypothetical protein FSC37_18135 [Piscinibacter aquaticus]|uniref:YCII-related domain-containing protein n=1 Tax=Piscinibacter aquaticus TaxID=392597 RepID=A0A5C6U2H6_9BURK|nr:hypothetical protein FSC37_18135 [Piscinibacter aquaticus]
MSQYLLLLHETPADFAQLSPSAMQEIIESHRAFAERRPAAASSPAARSATTAGATSACAMAARWPPMARTPRRMT